MMGCRLLNETQDEKRQRLRAAGKEKLEEFKRRNVELLPGPRISSARAYNPGLGIPAPSPQHSLPMNMMDVPRALPGYSFQIKRVSPPLPLPPQQPQALTNTREAELDGAGQYLPPLDGAAARVREGDAAASSAAEGASQAGAPSSSGGPLRADCRTDSGAATFQGSPEIRPAHRPIQTPPKGSAPWRRDAESGGRQPESSMDADNPLVLMLIEQMKGMKEEKQELLRQLEELCVENGNLQELVGFLTEGADLRADLSRGPSEEYQEELDAQYGDDAGGMYGPSEGELLRADGGRDGIL